MDQRPLLTIEKVLFLRSIPIFAQMRDADLAELAAIVEEVHARPGERIFAKGDISQSMYIVVSGQVRVHDGDRTIAMLGPRDLVGELSALDPEPRLASVTAFDETHFFRLDHDPLFELMSEHTSVARALIHVLCDRLRAEVRTRDVPAPSTRQVLKTLKA